MVRRCFIVIAISWAASSLTLTAAASLAALPQAEDQRPGCEREQLGHKIEGIAGAKEAQTIRTRTR